MSIVSASSRHFEYVGVNYGQVVQVNVNNYNCVLKEKFRKLTLFKDILKLLVDYITLVNQVDW